MATRQRSSAEKQPARDADFDPAYEWLDENANYLLRLNLTPGFKKEDFQVHVDPAGRLTIRGQRQQVDGAAAGSLRLHKVFQLPPTSNLDGITGRLEGSVLTITVPKLPARAAAAPSDRRIEVARARLAGRERAAAQEEDMKPKAAAAPPPSEMAGREYQNVNDDKARAAEHKAKVGREAERRIEAARARLAAPPERQEKGISSWKERVAEEGLKWAEAAGKKKEVIATAVAAFTLGVFVSHKLFSRN